MLILFVTFILVITIAGCTTQNNNELNDSVSGNIEITNLGLSSEKIYLGENASISVVVKNTASSNNSKTIELLINGEAKRSQIVKLAPNQDKTLSFELSNQEIGHYRVEVGELSKDYFVVPEDLGNKLNQVSASREKGKIILTWPTIEGITKYRVYRDGEALGTTKNNSYVDRDIESAKTYHYVVKAVIDDVVVKESNEVTAEAKEQKTLRFSNISIEKEDLVVNETFDVLVNVKNLLDKEITKKITLYANGNYLDSKTITFKPNEELEAPFTIYSSRTSRFNLSVGDVSTIVKVESRVSLATHAEVSTMTENWDRGAENDGVLVYPSLLNEEDETVKFTDNELNVSIRVWSTRMNEDYETVKDELVYSGSGVIDSWKDGNIFYSGSGIKVPFSEIQAESSDNQYGIIEITIQSQKHGEFRAKSETVNINPPENKSSKQNVSVSVVEVIDGDTLEIRYLNNSLDTVRLLGVDTPEVYSENDPSEFEGISSASYLRTWGYKASNYTKALLINETITLSFDKESDKRGYFGRLLAYVVLENGSVLNELLIKKGYARVYEAGEFSKEINYLEIEERARENYRGLWQKLNTSIDKGVVIVDARFDAPGNDHNNPNGEWIKIKNKANEVVDLDGYKLTDSDGHVFNFPDTYIDPGKNLFVYTGQGENNETALYWGSGSAIWNNGGDTAYLYNEKGELVDTYQWN